MGRKSYLIEGLSGTGKTSVCEELERRGLHARHAPDLVSLVFRLLFAGIGLVLLLDGVATVSLEWIVPLAVIGLGALLVWTGVSRRVTDG